MKVIVKLPIEIPEEAMAELAERAADQLVNDERDLAPVVRCRDCKYQGKLYACMFYKDKLFEDDFCSKGERKT